MIFLKEKGEFIFPIADGRIKTPGGDQELRTSTLVRHRPIQGESNIDFLGESEVSLPQPQDSLPDATEAMNDFWSMSGNFIYRHHVEPRVKHYSPREESFPIPLRYIDVSRTTHTNLDVKQEKRIDDYWNIDGSRDLSDPWTGFTQFTLLEGKPPDGYTWSAGRLMRKQQTSRPDHLWPELWKSMGKHAKLKEKQKWSEDKIHLENARKLRGIYFIDPEDTEFKETIKNARKKLETSVAPAMPCKMLKNCGSGGSDKIQTKLACILEAGPPGLVQDDPREAQTNTWSCPRPCTTATISREEKERERKNNEMFGSPPFLPFPGPPPFWATLDWPMSARLWF